jgi:hypothetical protein
MQASSNNSILQTRVADGPMNGQQMRPLQESIAKAVSAAHSRADEAHEIISQIFGSLSDGKTMTVKTGGKTFEVSVTERK